ncbi:MAG: hypothetical protein JRC55_03655 [Deltaproteobacteria bacterium]|nr:hypothetical protein [Deltaproteobacteria bacterium]
MNGNGVNESLIGQEFDAESFFGSRVFRLSMDDSGRITQQDSIDVPTGFNLLGAIMADLDKNKIKETAYYNPGGKLVVYEANKQKWESASRFDPVKIMLIDDMVNKSNAPKDVPVWPQSALFSSDPVLFAVVPANQTGIWSIVGGRSMYDNELYIAVVEGNIFTGRGKTHIIAVPMNVLKKSIK